jgi:hypothetical protein
MKSLALSALITLVAAASASAVDCPASIRMVGGGKLQADFGSARNYSVRVSGTSDEQRTAGNSGMWTSSDKYSSTAVTLEILKPDGSVDAECEYDASGQLVEAPAHVASITDFMVTPAGSDAVIAWKSVAESGVDFYLLEGRTDNSAPFGFINFIAPMGSGATYAYTDNPPSLPFTYRLSVQFTNGSGMMLAEGTVGAPTSALKQHNR